MPININDIINAFESFGDCVVHNQALQSKLREQGFDIEEIVTEINKAIANEVLEVNSTGEIRKT